MGVRKTEEMSRIKVEVPGVLPLFAGVGEVMVIILIVSVKLQTNSYGGDDISSS